jgi:hypothetical protein
MIGSMNMAKKIELGLVLTGEDAVRFRKLMVDPEYTPKTLEVLKRAKELYLESEKKG